MGLELVKVNGYPTSWGINCTVWTPDLMDGEDSSTLLLQNNYPLIKKQNGRS